MDLSKRSQQNSSLTCFEPVILTDERLVSGLLKKEPYTLFTDLLERQLKELFFIENHEFIGQDKESVYQSNVFKNYLLKKEKDYRFIYFPWQRTVVKCIGQDSYFTLKTNRNQDLISSREQQRLREYSVAVFGMSVGSNIAFVLTQAGISEKITLSDFDTLETTNLNRILAGVCQIGLNKTVIAARKIYEDNPYATVHAYPEGVTKELLRKLVSSDSLHLVIDEIDNLPLKIEIRKIAREYKKPVLMITDNGEGILLTLERYDLDYEQIFEKDDSYWNDVLEKPLTRSDMGKIIVEDIVGGIQSVDPKMIASVGKVLNKELVSWPQLGSAAILGGVTATVAIKKMVLADDKIPYKKIHIRIGV